MTRAKDISKIITDADFSGTLDVTGDLSVDNATLKVDSTNNRVGISTSSMTSKFEVAVSDNTSIQEAITIKGTQGGAYGGYLGWKDNWSGDSYTGYRGAIIADVPSANTGRLRFFTANSSTLSEKMRINANGQLLLGTTTSRGKFTIGVDSSSADGLYLDNANGGATMDLALLGSGYNAHGANAGEIWFYSPDNINIGGATGNTNSIKFLGGGAERMRITSAGNVGIGTSPDSQLTIGGNVITTLKPTVAISDTTSGATMTLRGQSPKIAFDATSSGVPKILMDNQGLEFKTGTLDAEGDVDFKIESSGNITVTDGSISSGVTHTFNLFGATGTGGSANYVTYSFVGDPNTGMFSGTADTLKFATGGAERMRITSAGTMTMGTASSLTDVSGITLRKDTQGGYPTLLFLQNQPGTGGTMGADIHMGYASDYGTILRFYGNPFNSRPGGLQVRRVTGSGTSEVSLDIATNGLLKSTPTYNNTTGSSANIVVFSDGQFARTTSSLRYKNTVNDATHGLTELLTLRPVTYKGNNDGDTVFGGLIAEEVHDAGLTEFVTYNDDGEPDALAYGNMVSLCIKAIQELKTELDEAKARITALETA